MLQYQSAHKSIAVYDYSDLKMRKMKIFVNTLAKKLNTASGIYGSPIGIPITRKIPFCVLRSLKTAKNG